MVLEILDSMPVLVPRARVLNLWFGGGMVGRAISGESLSGRPLWAKELVSYIRDSSFRAASHSSHLL